LAGSGRMAELVDALGSGLSVRKDMGVQVPLRPPGQISSIDKAIFGGSSPTNGANRSLTA
jgi:hypothetical protein